MYEVPNMCPAPRGYFGAAVMSESLFRASKDAPEHPSTRQQKSVTDWYQEPHHTANRKHRGKYWEVGSAGHHSLPGFHLG